MTALSHAERSRDPAHLPVALPTSAVATDAPVSAAAGFLADQEHIRAIRGCWALPKLDALIWKRRCAIPQPTDAERNAWREHRAKLMRSKA